MESLLIQLSNLPHWQIALLATYLLLQGFFFAPFPEEVIITTLGLLWSQGKIGFVEAWIAIWVGLLPANSMTVYIGGRFGPNLMTMRPFSWVFKKDAIDEAMVQVRKYGPWIVFVTRFIPIIRGPIYFAAGLSKMGVPRFFRNDVLAACFQVPGLLLLGSMMGQGIGNMMEGYRRIGIFMGSLLLSVFTIRWTVRWILNRKKQQALGQAAVSKHPHSPIPID